MNIEDICSKTIEDIQQNQCVNCAYGKVLIACLDVKKLYEPKEQAEAPASPLTPVLDPARNLPADSSNKITEKIHTRPALLHEPSSSRNRRQEIADYLENHPLSSSPQIGQAIGMSENGVLYSLHRMGDLVQQHGGGPRSRWSLRESDNPAAKVPEAPKNAPAPPASPKREKWGNPIPELKFKCEACHAKFLSQKQLNAHNETTHGGKQADEIKFQCEHCDRVFATDEALEDHIELRHPDKVTA